MMWMQKRRQFFTLLFAPVFTSFTSKEYDTTRFLTNNLFFSNLIMSQVCVNISSLNIIWGSNNATIINIARIHSKECWILLCYLFKGIFLLWKLCSRTFSFSFLGIFWMPHESFMILSLLLLSRCFMVCSTKLMSTQMLSFSSSFNRS